MNETPAVGTQVTSIVKNWYISTTVWLAILQALAGLISGLILLLQTGVNDGSLGALLVGLKGLIDLRQRFITSAPIK